jgi:hypothetical protein
VKAWGDNTYGQLNIPAGLNKIIAVAAGSYHNLALENNGTVVAWGYNLFGQTNVPAGLNNIVAIAAGGLHSLALKNDGTVVAWGDNTFGQTNVPAGLSNIVAIAAGGAHSVAMNTNGVVVVWGTDADGETNSPGYLASAISAELDHTVEIYNNNVSVWDWSFAGPGLPQQYGLNFTTVAAVAAGGYHDLALADRNQAASAGVAPQAVEAGMSLAGGFKFTLNWIAPTNEAFMVQWTPAVSTVQWHTLTNVITSTSGVFTFTDDGSETGGNANERFYRLMLTQ